MVGCAALSLLFPNVLALFPPTQPVAAAPIIRWAYYVTYAKDSFTALQANVGALTMVSPYYFTLPGRRHGQELRGGGHERDAPRGAREDHPDGQE